MEQRSLRVLEGDKTFFTRISTTISKLLIPTKIGINGIMITMKRNNLLKAYENYKFANTQEGDLKLESVIGRYEEAYSLYLESIDKYVMDSVYKKVKSGTASNFEKDALSKYYTITHLKETEYLEYKHKKQKYLLELDYDTIVALNKEKLTDRYLPFYLEKVDSLYKGILKNYSIQLADNLTAKLQGRDTVYEKIFEVIEEYVISILPLKKDSIEETVKRQKEEFDRFEVGKLDEKDILEKNKVLLAISRNIFTHSLPLIVAEQCYQKLIEDARNLVETTSERKQIESYVLLLNIMTDYHAKLLSTKVYWDKPEKRDQYKTFWESYKQAKTEEEKEALLIRNDLASLYEDEQDKRKIVSIYKEKLVIYGFMRELKSCAKSKAGKFVKKQEVPAA